MDLLLPRCRCSNLLVVILLLDSLARSLLSWRLHLALCIGGLLRYGGCSGRGGRLRCRHRLGRLSFGGLRALEAPHVESAARTWIFSMSPRRTYLLPADAAAFSSATLRLRSSSSFLSLSMPRGAAREPGARLRLRATVVALASRGARTPMDAGDVQTVVFDCGSSTCKVQMTLLSGSSTISLIRLASPAMTRLALCFRPSLVNLGRIGRESSRIMWATRRSPSAAS